MRDAAFEAYRRALQETPANPASLHRPGRRAQGVLEEARERVAARLTCSAREVIFTGSATEANNLGLLGAARAAARLQGRAVALVSSKAEHPSVLGPLRLLQQEGHALTLAPLDAHARVDVDALLAERANGVGAIALQWANNETGAVQDLARFAAGLDDTTHWHCDAVQGAGKLPWESALARSDTLTLAGHKMGAPRGVAVLRVAERAFLDPVLGGGGQQRGIRPGTECPALATAFAVALEMAMEEQEVFATRTRRASAELLREVRAEFADVRENHPPEDARLPNTLNLSFPGIDGRQLLPACDAEGLAVASGSACSSGSAQPSAVLLACGLDEDAARASLRISFGRDAHEDETRLVADRLRMVLRRLYRVANR